MTKPKSGADRVAAHKERKEASGLVQVYVRAWVKPKDADKARAAMRRAAEKFTKER